MIRLVEDKEVPMARIDDAVTRILRMKLRLDLFEQPFSSAACDNAMGSEEHRDLARQAVRESLVLLKNKDGILPLSKEERVIVVGSHADDVAFQSGVPVGYVQATSFLGSAEINFNIFDSFRGAQARHVFRAVLAMVRADVGCDTFIMNTQQLGEDNDEALKTGAWWFYHKHGFRPRDAMVIQVMNTELAKKARVPSHRSDRATLRKLASAPLLLPISAM